ncbi:TIGR01212 family radical SAM protein [Sedimentibacter sp. zth1]|uniref:TIGR01212 family radical SAM protein n=1 Tax=Sedimentibacter sp. zth1 TaxID=2816908 RepID=UPI001A933118|nr:TIGR01212 family radical SAM protein [Sedimentibacter sp. zth1]QSX05138.1 TIGR01212 family radical SAM protein [Sedimentibacter sp. zth1]
MDWNCKNYHTLDFELKKYFGEKAIKLSINGGFTCPNRDGSINTCGCIFCSEKGSGDFAGNVDNSINNQINEQIKFLSNKWKSNTYIAYFQSFTNTYDSVINLEKKYTQALNCPNIKGLAIATRPDCINENIAKLLSSYNDRTYLWVELGLQTIHKNSSDFIRRGYDLDVFNNAISMLKKYNIRVVVHLILGLPNESNHDILESVQYVCTKGIWGIKLHLLHVLKNTDLANYYYENNMKLYTQEEYINLVCDCIEIMPQDVVIHRLTGDGKRSELIAPEWSLHKLKVLSAIDIELRKRNSYQGLKFNQEQK